MELELDTWQETVLNTEGNLCLKSGRQVGKSTVISIKAGDYAVNNAKKSVMIISATERQAYLLFEKVLFYINDKYKKLIKKGKDRPTKTTIKLTNGSIIRCLPTGMSGLGIRGYTVDLLIADEAAFIPEDVWGAVTPMLLTTGGHIILLSTPFGRQGYFYDCYTKDDSFTKFSVSSPEVAKSRPEPMRTRMLEHLEHKRATMPELVYAQEYLGEFIDELRQFFPDNLIIKCMNVVRPQTIDHNYKHYLGIDVARMGEDESTFEVVRLENNSNHLRHVENQVTTKTLLSQTTNNILALNRLYNFKRIYIDDGGIGVGVFDYLLTNSETKRKVVPINNRSRPLDPNDKHKKKILKEDLYNNLLMLMEQGRISLLDDPEVFQSLKSVQYEYSEDAAVTKMKIFGNYTHICEGLIRAAWCMRDKSLNIWVASV